MVKEFVDDAVVVVLSLLDILFNTGFIIFVNVQTHLLFNTKILPHIIYLQFLSLHLRSSDFCAVRGE